MCDGCLEADNVSCRPYKREAGQFMIALRLTLAVRVDYRALNDSHENPENFSVHRNLITNQRRLNGVDARVVVEEYVVRQLAAEGPDDHEGPWS